MRGRRLSLFSLAVSALVLLSPSFEQHAHAHARTGDKRTNANTANANRDRPLIVPSSERLPPARRPGQHLTRPASNH